MFKTLISTMFLSAVIASPCFAYGGWYDAEDSTAATGAYGHTDGRTTETNQDYQHVSNFGNLDLAGQGFSAPTNTQGAFTPNGPHLAGTPGGFFPFSGQSGAATSAPIRGTMIAPGNLALRQMGKSTLPPTRLEGFVKASGKNDDIYGDEGIYLPKAEGFTEEHRIGAGIHSPYLTTGHPSNGNLPSSWDYPE